jgi:hypothetical protein
MVGTQPKKYTPAVNNTTVIPTTQMAVLILFLSSAGTVFSDPIRAVTKAWSIRSPMKVSRFRFYERIVLLTAQE